MGAPVAEPESWEIGEVRLVQATRVEIGADGTPVEVAYEEWEIDLDTPGGRLTHFLPVSTVAWRIAEYGLDPGDPEHHALALDMALHEPHIPQPEEPQPRSTMVKRWTPAGVVDELAVVMKTANRAAAYSPAENLLTAATLDDARETHLAHIARAKERVRIAASAAAPSEPVRASSRTDLRGGGSPMLAASPLAAGPLDWILQHTGSVLDVADVAEKRAGIEQARQLHAERQL